MRKFRKKRGREDRHIGRKERRERFEKNGGLSVTELVPVDFTVTRKRKYTE